MKFVRFKDPQDRNVWLRSDWVTRVSMPLSGEYPSGTNTVIWFGGERQAVKEHPDEVIVMLEQAG